MSLRKLAVLSILILIFISLSCSAEESSLARIVIYGDSRAGYNRHQQIVDAILSKQPSVVFHTGDLVTDNPNQWSLFNKITNKLRSNVEFYPAVGNHEYDAGIESFLANFELPNNEQWYSIERYGVHFIILNSCVSIDQDSPQYKWLIAELESIGEQTNFTVVIFHHPPFSAYKGDEQNLQATLVPILEKYAVDIVFNGHTHAYERALYNNTYYITTGGGGAPLHQQQKQGPYTQKYIKTHHFCLLYIYRGRLEIQALDSNLKLIDEVRVNKQAAE